MRRGARGRLSGVCQTRLELLVFEENKPGDFFLAEWLKQQRDEEKIISGMV